MKQFCQPLPLSGSYENPCHKNLWQPNHYCQVFTISPPPPTFLTSKMQDLFMSLLILIRKFLIEVESTININVFKLLNTSRIVISFWETTHLPLSYANVYFALSEK